MTPEDAVRAKELFFTFDGSEFYMSRDGVDTEFEALNVPRDLRRAWMRELTSEHVAALGQPGNWKTLRFLSHHHDYSHVPDALAARPLGVWWEQVAFLEHLLGYVRVARWLLRASGSDLVRAAEMTLDFGPSLLATAPPFVGDGPLQHLPESDQRDRVETLLRSARRRARWRV